MWQLQEDINRFRAELNDFGKTDGFCDWNSDENSDGIDSDQLCDVSRSSISSFEMTSFASERRKRDRELKSRIPVKGRRPPSPMAKRELNERVQLAKSPGHKVYSQVPTNFLAPNLADFTNIAICIFEGRDFPRSRLGERSTYVVVHLHGDLPVVKSPIAFNQTTNAIYNGGFDLNCMGVDFSSVVPVVLVYDFLSEQDSELIGIGYIQYQQATLCDSICVILQNEWIDIVTVNTRTKCGRVRMSLIFHDKDIPFADVIKIKISKRKEHISGVVLPPEASKPGNAWMPQELGVAPADSKTKVIGLVSQAVQVDEQRMGPKVEKIENLSDLKCTFEEFSFIPRVSKLSPKFCPKPIDVVPRKFISEDDLGSEEDLVASPSDLAVLTETDNTNKEEENAPPIQFVCYSNLGLF
jgi:hypothetical protein